jgi:hypothetical protein
MLKIIGFFVIKLLSRLCVGVGVLYACRKNSHDHIISLRGKVWANKTGLSPSLFFLLKCLCQGRKGLGVSIVPLSTILIFDFGIIPTVWYFLFFNLLLKLRLSSLRHRWPYPILDILSRFCWCSCSHRHSDLILFWISSLGSVDVLVANDCVNYLTPVFLFWVYLIKVITETCHEIMDQETQSIVITACVSGKSHRHLTFANIKCISSHLLFKGC